MYASPNTCAEPSRWVFALRLATVTSVGVLILAVVAGVMSPTVYRATVRIGGIPADRPLDAAFCKRLSDEIAAYAESSQTAEHSTPHAGTSNDADAFRAGFRIHVAPADAEDQAALHGTSTERAAANYVVVTYRGQLPTGADRLRLAADALIARRVPAQFADDCTAAVNQLQRTQLAFEQALARVDRLSEEIEAAHNEVRSRRITNRLATLSKDVSPTNMSSRSRRNGAAPASAAGSDVSDCLVALLEARHVELTTVETLRQESHQLAARLEASRQSIEDWLAASPRAEYTSPPATEPSPTWAIGLLLALGVLGSAWILAHRRAIAPAIESAHQARTALHVPVLSVSLEPATAK